MAKSQAPPQVQPGQLFDVPGGPGGGTKWQETYESTNTLAVTLAQGAQVTANGITKFNQTDIVLDWLLNLKVTQTFTGGTGQTLTNSAYAPFNQIGPVELKIQNQYSSIKVESGIDWYIFNLIRPMRQAQRGGLVVMGANPMGDPVGGTATGYYTTALAQANQYAAQWANSNASWQSILRIPASQWFDRYFDLAPTGEPIAPPHAAVVSPQFMAGTTRNITPSIVFNGMLGGVTDAFPVNTTTLTPTTDTASTASGTATLTFKRRALYQGDPLVLPPVYAWQYAWQTTRFSVSGVTKATLPIPPESGQVLALYLRFFDPSANSGVGAPININTFTKIQLQYGSGLLYFDDTPDTLQERWHKLHGFMLPQGVLAWDLAMDDRGLITNARCLNLLTTAGCVAYFETGTTTLSSTAYCVMGTESLVYVS